MQRGGDREGGVSEALHNPRPPLEMSATCFFSGRLETGKEGKSVRQRLEKRGCGRLEEVTGADLGKGRDA